MTEAALKLGFVISNLDGRQIAIHGLNTNTHKHEKKNPLFTLGAICGLGVRG